MDGALHQGAGRSRATLFPGMTTPNYTRWAIATLWDGAASSACALLAWCATADRLASTRGGDVVLLSREPSGDCPFAQRVWDKETANLVTDYMRRVAPNSTSLTLAKWMVFGLLHYQIVLFADLDVDVTCVTRIELVGPFSCLLPSLSMPS